MGLVVPLLLVFGLPALPATAMGLKVDTDSQACSAAARPAPGSPAPHSTLPLPVQAQQRLADSQAVAGR